MKPKPRTNYTATTIATVCCLITAAVLIALLTLRPNIGSLKADAKSNIKTCGALIQAIEDAEDPGHRQALMDIYNDNLCFRFERGSLPAINLF